MHWLVRISRIRWKNFFYPSFSLPKLLIYRVIFAQNILCNSILFRKKEKMVCCKIINYLTYYKFSLVSAIWALMLWFSIIVLKALKTVFLCWQIIIWQFDNIGNMSLNACTSVQQHYQSIYTFLLDSEWIVREIHWL